MRAVFMSAGVLIAMSGAAQATSLICQNPRQEYNLVYEQGDASVTINPDGPTTKWPVLSQVRSDG